MSDATRTRVPSAVRTQQAIDIAVDEFGTHGFDGTSMQALARRLGVSKVILYRLFGDTLSLYRAAVEEAGRRLGVVVEEAQAAIEGTSRSERAGVGVRAVLDGMRLNAKSVALLRDVPHDANAAAIARAEHERFNQALLATMVRSGRDRFPQANKDEVRWTVAFFHGGLMALFEEYLLASAADNTTATTDDSVFVEYFTTKLVPILIRGIAGG